MQTLADIQAEMDRRANEARRLQRLVHSNRFLDAFRPGDFVPLDNIEEWLEQRIEEDIDAMSVRKLREVASGLGIAKYTQWSKLTLTIKVKNALKAKNAPGRVPPNEGGPGVGVGGLGGLVVLSQPGT